MVILLLALVALPPRVPGIVARADDGGGTLVSMPLPGGTEGVRASLGDRLPPTRALLVVDLARRFYNAPIEPGSPQSVALIRMLAGLESSAASSAAPAETIPLPIGPAFWTDVVLERTVAPAALLPALLRDRHATLFYTALVSLDDETRRFIAASPGLARRVARAHAGAFVVAAPWLRVTGGRVKLPGSPEADAVWEALAGESLSDPVRAVPALLRADAGRLAYLVEVMGGLDPARRRHAFRLDDPDASRRVEAGRALLQALGRVVTPWRPDERPFWRPAVDPATSLREVGPAADGGLQLPGRARFWEAAFETGPAGTDDAERWWRQGPPLSAAWLVEQIAAERANPLTRVAPILFAARHFDEAPAARAAAVLTVLRGHAAFPELLPALERSGITDLDSFVAMVRTAERLQALPPARRVAAIAQWQSLLIVVGRSWRSNAADEASRRRLIAAISRAEPDEDGRLAPAALRGLASFAGSSLGDADARARALETAVLGRLSPATAPASATAVTWEGTRYRLDFAAAERQRLEVVRGGRVPPWIDAAALACTLADLTASTGTNGARRAAAEALAVAMDAMVAADDQAVAPAGAPLDREIASAWTVLRGELALPGRQGRGPDGTGRRRLLDLADALTTRGLVEIVYALSLGSGEWLPLRSADASSRHVFHVSRPGLTRLDRAWHAPRVVVETGRPWYVEGSLLTLDVTLAPLALRRLSLKPPPTAPPLNEGDRRVLVESVVLIDRRAFTEEGSRRVVAAIARARRRLSDVNGPAAARELAHRAGMSAMRRELAAWIFEYDRAHWSSSVSMTELLAIGWEGEAGPAVLPGWGNSERPVRGRVSAGDIARRPWEEASGRLGTGLLAAAVPDLQIRLVELLATLDLPAWLVPDLMVSATLDFVNTVPSRHPDDWSALVSHVQAIDVAALERYLGLLTTTGPLRVHDK